MTDPFTEAREQFWGGYHGAQQFIWDLLEYIVTGNVTREPDFQREGET